MTFRAWEHRGHGSIMADFHTSPLCVISVFGKDSGVRRYNSGCVITDGISAVVLYPTVYLLLCYIR